MKIKYLFLLIIITFYSCNDLLDKEPEEYIKTENALNSISSLQAALYGTYSELQSPNYYGRNMFVLGDLLADNTKIAPNNSDKFISFYNHTFTPSEPEIEGLWSSCYKVINKANAILTAIPNIKDSTNASLNQIKAEALSLRALAYFDLFRVFSFPYRINNFVENANSTGGHACVPLVLEASTADSIINPKRATSAEIYSQIVNDLKESISLYNEETTVFRFSKEASYALLAKAALQINDYANAFNNVVKLFDNEKYSLVPNEEYVDSWSKEFTSESIFSIAMTSTDYNGTDALGYIYLRGGYNDIYPTQDLISLYSTSDVRSQLIDKSTEIKKYPGRDNIIGLDNIPVIRYSEVLLILAEASSFYPQFENVGLDALNEIVMRADTNAVPYTIMGKELLPYIREERRKELAFEGNRFFDQMRLQQSVLRNDCSASKCEIKFPSKTCALPIPQHELNSNKEITQNPEF